VWVDQHRLRSMKRVRTELRRVKPNAGHPLLTRRACCLVVSPARSPRLAQEPTRPASRQAKIIVDCLSGLDRPSGLLCRSSRGPSHTRSAPRHRRELLRRRSRAAGRITNYGGRDAVDAYQQRKCSDNWKAACY
jgi:hypothetical protein